MKKLLLGSVAAITVLSSSAAMAADMAFTQPVGAPAFFRWSGPYAGFSLGAGALHAKTSGSSTFISTEIIPSSGFTDTQASTSAIAGNSRFEAGALADLYIGYNFLLANYWMTGVQVEGSLGRFFSRFNASGTSGFVETRSDVGVNNVANGTFTENHSLNINFMVSALARFGYLASSRDLFYGLAGWTFADFSTTLPSSGDPSFGANGLTIGAGWERQILETWTLKLEYRYTKFQTVDISQTSAFTSTNFNDGTPTSISLNTTNNTASISPSLHVLRLGLTRYFGDEVGMARAAYYKAAPAYAPAYSWTGFYTGFSVGVGAMRSNATTDFSSASVATTPEQGIYNQRFDNGTISGGGRLKPGGVADLFLGYNQQMMNWVLGAQIEGSVARFGEQLTRNRANSSSSFSKNTAVSPLALNQTFTFSGTVDDTLSANWMVSGLARVGYLVDPRTMFYGLGGWTHAGFSTSIESDDGNRTFTAGGPSVGIGGERQIADLWSFRAEYRYTKFLERTLTTDTSSSNATANLFGGGTANFASSFSSSTGIRTDLHMFRLGLARAISP